MKHFFVITNESKDKDFKVTSQISEYIRKNGGVALHGQASEMPDDTQAALVLGGDGTLLQAARELFERDIPLIGVNLGTLGFMAEVELTQLERALDALLTDAFTIEKRMMLDGVLADLAEENCSSISHALNDIVVTRKGNLCVLPFDVYVNGQFLATYQADGILIATPTGSTGYNMSAGGPIANPEAELILLTPICPHTLSHSSIILSEHDEIEIVLGEGREGSLEALISFDGANEMTIKSGYRLKVKKSMQYTRLLRISQAGFLENLHRKMSR